MLFSMDVVKGMKKFWDTYIDVVRIVLNITHLSTEQMVTSLGWDTLTRRRENHIVKLVEKCLKGTAPSYFSKYFQLKRHDIHDYDIRKKNKLGIDRVKLKSTKRAFFL